MDLLRSSPIFLVSNSLIRLYLYPPSCLPGFTLLFCFPSLCPMFSSFIFSLSCSVIKIFKAVNSPPTPPEAGSADVQSLSLYSCKIVCHSNFYLLCDLGVI